MRVNTFNMEIFYIDGQKINHKNISRVAVKTYLKYYEETLFVDRIVVKENIQ